MSSISVLFFALGVSNLTLVLVVPPPYFITDTRIPLAYAGDLVAAVLILSIHIYVSFKILLSTSDKITIETHHLLMFMIATSLLSYGCAYHAIAAPADLIINLGDSTQSMTYGGEFLHYLHEFVSHKIQHTGLFLFYITILNVVEAKLIWIQTVSKTKEINTKYLKCYMEFLNPSFGFVSCIMSLSHGILLGIFGAALDTNTVMVLFCAYLMKRTVAMKATIHKYLFYMSIATIVTLSLQNVMNTNIGISVLTDEGSDRLLLAAMGHITRLGKITRNKFVILNDTISQLIKQKLS
eukprot:619775_1